MSWLVWWCVVSLPVVVGMCRLIHNSKEIEA